MHLQGKCLCTGFFEYILGWGKTDKAMSSEKVCVEGVSPKRVVGSVKVSR